MAADAPLASPLDPKGSSARTRLALLLAGVGVLVTTGVFQVMSTQVMQRHEARAIAGDYQHLRLLAAHTVVDGEGKVDTGAPTRSLRLVASLRLTPPGVYEAVIMADDGNAKHLEKAEMVIAARDASGHWHPESAERLVARAQVVK